MIEFVPPSINYILIGIAMLFMVLDLITGFVQAVVNKCVDSSKMKNGLWHKCGFILAIVFACLCEYSMHYISLGFTMPLQQAVCSFIILTEVVSILENLGKISPELKESKFMQIFDRDDGKNNETKK